MGYLHIDNLYKNQSILLFRECYALEKVHGTSAHISWKYESKNVGFFTGGSHPNFISLFDHDFLKSKFQELFPDVDVVVYGEHYGGSIHGMSNTYGPISKFVAFDVKVNGMWVSVPNALDISFKLEIEFVDFVKCSTDLEDLDREMNKDSSQAIRNGMGGGKIREGVVLRPLMEMTLNNGSRIMSKHKRSEFMETKTKREISPEQLVIMTNAIEIAEEWVVPMRLDHVVDKLGGYENMSMVKMREVIIAMVEDVYREGQGEIVESKDVYKAIASKTSDLFKRKMELLS